WWPKCTPASRSSFIVSVAMVCLLRLASDPERRGPERAPRSPAGQVRRGPKLGIVRVGRPLKKACVFPSILRFLSTPSSRVSDQPPFARRPCRRKLSGSLASDGGAPAPRRPAAGGRKGGEGPLRVHVVYFALIRTYSSE